MLHSKVLDLMGKFGAGIMPRFALGKWKVRLNGHELHWGYDDWTHRIVKVEYFTPQSGGTGHHQNFLLQWPDRKVANGTLVKRFIERATEKEYRDRGIILTFGPDSRHPKLFPSLRARFAGWPGPECNMRCPQALAFGEAWIEGSCDPGVILDWLKEMGHLSEV